MKKSRPGASRLTLEALERQIERLEHSPGKQAQEDRAALQGLFDALCRAPMDAAWCEARSIGALRYDLGEIYRESFMRARRDVPPD
jgi:hypothetical protein